MVDRVAYDEFGLFHENAEEFGLPFDGPPAVRRESVEVDDSGRRLSALMWGTEAPEIVLLHGGAQNAHTWDTVALALDRPLVAIDLPGHGHSDHRPDGPFSPRDNASDVAVAIRALAPDAHLVVGMSLGGLTSIALTSHDASLVRKIALVDVTPGVDRDKAAPIAPFIEGESGAGEADTSSAARALKSKSATFFAGCGSLDPWKADPHSARRECVPHLIFPKVIYEPWPGAGRP
jgi:pimeloyl-ACP methyl ester carboxylesterase